jgi:hypothetical protein
MFPRPLSHLSMFQQVLRYTSIQKKDSKATSLSCMALLMLMTAVSTIKNAAKERVGAVASSQSRSWMMHALSAPSTPKRLRGT